MSRKSYTLGDIMADYIDRHTIIESIHSAIYPFFCGAEDGDELSEAETLVLSVNKAICTAIKALPRADVQPVRHGWWIEDKEVEFVCSECGEQCANTVMGMPMDRYCKWCGARMDGERK